MPSSTPPPFNIQTSARIARLPPYLFARINKLKLDKRQQNIDIIDLGMGNPTDPTPEPVVSPPERSRARSAKPPLFGLERHRGSAARSGQEV